MAVNLSIKNVPDEVVAALRGRAARNERSLQAELLDILKQAAKNETPVTIDDLFAVAERKKPALDEQASKVRAAHDADKERAARRFQDLLGGDDNDKS